MDKVSQKEIVEGLRNCHTTLMLQANPNDGHATHFRKYVDLLIKRIQANGIAPPEGYAIVPNVPVAWLDLNELTTGRAMATIVQNSFNKTAVYASKDTP